MPLPNIVVTGTPGTGKTTFSQLLLATLPEGFQHVNIGDVVKREKAYSGWNDEWDCWDVDEDKLLDALEPLFPARDDEDQLSKGGVILDHHGCDLFPERWVDLVVVMTCDHTVLWDRLEQRKYSLKKIQENNDAEIMQTCLSEAFESYPAEIVVQLPSNTHAEMEDAADKVKAWVEQWVSEHAGESSANE